MRIVDARKVFSKAASAFALGVGLLVAGLANSPFQTPIAAETVPPPNLLVIGERALRFRILDQESATVRPGDSDSACFRVEGDPGLKIRIRVLFDRAIGSAEGVCELDSDDQSGAYSMNGKGRDAVSFDPRRDLELVIPKPGKRGPGAVWIFIGGRVHPGKRLAAGRQHARLTLDVKAMAE